MRGSKHRTASPALAAGETSSALVARQIRMPNVTTERALGVVG
jgi:hypothetical protein